MLRDDPNNGREAGCLPSDFFFFFQAEQAVLQLVSFLYNFLPENDQHVSSHLDGGMGSVYVPFSSQSAELINFSVISRTTCLIMCSCDILLVHRMPISLN